MTTNPSTNENQIIELETRLLNAFTNKDIKTLDELIHNDAFFVLPNGQSLTKTMVLDNYRRGETAMTAINASDQKINFINDTAVVSMILELTGKANDQPISAKFRYLRVWKFVNDKWTAIAVSGVPLNK